MGHKQFLAVHIHREPKVATTGAAHQETSNYGVLYTGLYSENTPEMTKWLVCGLHSY